MTNLMPAIFIGHGNPMNAISKNIFTESWASIGKSIPRPRAVLSVSAHWYVPYCAVTTQSAPQTIHDFGGFPSTLYEVNYPAPGSPDLAIQVKQLLSPVSVILDESWGLDHGTWSVLTHIFPDADIPVIQLSIDERQPPEFHYKLGKRLETLRKEGVLILGSGNLVHNLHSYAWGQGSAQPFDWAIRFESRIRQLLSSGNDEQIIEYQKLGHDARLAVPTPDHYLPMLYVIGLRSEQDKISFPVEGVDGGSISMLTIQVG